MTLRSKILWSLAFLCLATFVGLRSGDIGKYVKVDIGRFLRTGADYEGIYNYVPSYALASRVKNVLPPRARITFSPPSMTPGIMYFGLRYAFYPCRLSEDWDYFVDFDHSGPPPETTAAIHNSSGIAVYAKPGHPFMLHHEVHAPFLGRQVLVFAILSLWILAVGALALTALGFRPHPAERIWFYSAGYLTGILASGGSLWLMLLVPVDLNPASLECLMGIITAALLLWAWFATRGRPAGAPPAFPPDSRPCRPVALALQIPALGIIGAMLLLIICWPVNVWDEFVIWNMKAKSMALDHGLDFSYLFPAHNYYPILWPAHNAFFLTLIGNFDEMTKWTSALAYLAFLSQLRSGLAILGVRRTWLGPLVAVYAVLFHHWSFHTALPENLLMAYMTALIVCMLGRMTPSARPGRWMALAVVMAAGLTLVKAEGGLIVLTCACALMVLHRRITWRNIDTAGMAGIILALFLPGAWLLWLHAHHVAVWCFPVSGGTPSENFLAMIDIVEEFLTDTGCVGLFPVLILSFWPNGRKTWLPQEQFLGIVTVALIIFALGGGLMWPADELETHYMEVFTRILVRATPAFALLWASRVLGRPPHGSLRTP